MGNIENNFNLIKQEIVKACQKSHRSAQEVNLICVSKTHSKEKIISAYKAGARLFGENKVQEALEKFPLGPEFPEAQLHYIGRLQSNKLRKIYPLASVFHSIDSFKILTKMQDLGREFGTVKKVFLQLNISGEQSKAGFVPDEIMGLIPQLEPFSHIEFCGLMGIGPNTSEVEEIKLSFRRLRQIKEQILKKYAEKLSFLASFKELSMGMSQDFHIAIEEGSHYLRIGTAIFGERNYSAG